MADIIIKLLICLIPFWASFVAIKLAHFEDVRYELNKKEKILVFVFDVLISGMMIFRYDYLGWGSILFGLMFGCLAVSAVIDYKLQELPDVLTGLSWLFALAYLMLQSSINFIEINYTKQILTGLAFLVTGGLLAFGGAGFGFGDAKLMFVIGMLMFNVTTMIDFWMRAIIFAIIHILLIIFYKKSQKWDLADIKAIKIAFGPYLIMAFALMLIGI